MLDHFGPADLLQVLQSEKSRLHEEAPGERQSSRQSGGTRIECRPPQRIGSAQTGGCRHS